MDLKSFLKWEIPIVTYSNRNAAPKVYLVRKSSKVLYEGLRLLFNSAWCQSNISEIVKDKTSIGLSVSIDRENKELFVVFDPPMDIPQYEARSVYKKSKSVQLMNKVLLYDIWNIFNIPDIVHKQYLDVERFQVIDEKQIWKLSYNSKSGENTRLVEKANQDKKIKK